MAFDCLNPQIPNSSKNWSSNVTNLVFPSPRQKLLLNRSHVLTLTCLGQPALPAMVKFARCARRSCPWRLGSRTNPRKEEKRSHKEWSWYSRSSYVKELEGVLCFSWCYFDGGCSAPTRSPSLGGDNIYQPSKTNMKAENASLEKEKHQRKPPICWGSEC